MKHTICLLLVALAFTACKKEEVEGIRLEKTFPGAMDTGKAGATRDGEPWQASAFAKFHPDSGGYIGMSFRTFSEEGFNREVHTITEIPLKRGKYPIKGHISEIYDGFVGSVYSWLVDDGDVAGPLYDHDDTVPGFLELTMVDTVAKKITGNFDRMVFKNRRPSSFYPLTVVFENGTFEMAIIE